MRRVDPAQVPAGEEQFHRRVWRHRVGTPTSQDVLVWGQGLDPTNYYGCSVSLDGRWLVVSASAGTAPRDDVWLFDLSAPGSPPVVLQEGVDARLSAHVGRDGRLYLHTDRDAPRGRVCVADPATPTEWTELVAEDPEAVLEDVELLAGAPGEPDRLVVLRSRHAVSELSVDGVALELPGLGSIGGLSVPPEGGSEVWFGWTDTTTPHRVHRYDAATGQLSLWASPPGTVDLPEVRTRLIEVTSADGTTVRALVVSPTVEPDRPRPTVLYGYGGFGVALTPGYTSSALAWVEAGGVWVVANLRGGSEEGEQWHRDGMRGQQAERLRRLRGGRRRPGGARVDHTLAAGHLRREQRRPARGGRAHPASGRLRRGGLLGPAPGHGPLRAVRARSHLERRVRHGRRPRGARLVARATRPTTAWSRARPTRRCCSRSSTATAGSTRCTPASSAPPCSTPPPPAPRCCCATRGRRPRRPLGQPHGRALGRPARLPRRPHRSGALTGARAAVPVRGRPADHRAPGADGGRPGRRSCAPCCTGWCHGPSAARSTAAPR